MDFLLSYLTRRGLLRWSAPPGAVATELPESDSEEATKKNLRVFYKMAIPANSIASVIAYVIEQPAEVEIDQGCHPAQVVFRRVVRVTLAEFPQRL